MAKIDTKRIWVAGAHGMAGSAIERNLIGRGFDVLPSPTHDALDLTNQAATRAWVQTHKPTLVFLAAAKVGGIADNDAHPADFMAQNLLIQTNVITACAACDVPRLVFLGSSCIYPRACPQPMAEDALFTGPLEPTNRAYAMAKLAGIEMCHAYHKQHGLSYFSVLPCNLYGPGDTYDALRSHVIPALFLKIYDAIQTKAPTITLWGTGAAVREFMHVDDMADACVHLALTKTDACPVNIGTGQGITIANLAKMLCEIAGYKGSIVYDASMPDGTPRKILDTTLLSAASWRPRLSLRSGLAQLWAQFLQARS